MRMLPIPATPLIALAVLVAGLGFGSPAGPSEPFRVRNVTMNGVSGAAYYSQAAGAFRFVAPAPAAGRVAALETGAR